MTTCAEFRRAAGRRLRRKRQGSWHDCSFPALKPNLPPRLQRVNLLRVEHTHAQLGVGSRTRAPLRNQHLVAADDHIQLHVEVVQTDKVERVHTGRQHRVNVQTVVPQSDSGKTVNKRLEVGRHGRQVIVCCLFHLNRGVCPHLRINNKFALSPKFPGQPKHANLDYLYDSRQSDADQLRRQSLRCLLFNDTRRHAGVFPISCREQELGLLNGWRETLRKE